MNRYRPACPPRPVRPTSRSRLALLLAVLAVPVGTALGGALLTGGAPATSAPTDHTVQLGCAGTGGCARR